MFFLFYIKAKTLNVILKYFHLSTGQTIFIKKVRYKTAFDGICHIFEKYKQNSRTCKT